jgi:16S rRNA (uracil1498-N3)-methyltransferase
VSARFYADLALKLGDDVTLPDHAARHVQVLRLQPDGLITLFNSRGGEFEARITRMGRSDVQVLITGHRALERETPRAVHLAVGMPANERMDWLVEKASELGAASITPLMAERSVLRLKGERADKKVAHWQGVAVAACEQCGRNRLPPVHGISPLAAWLASLPAAPAQDLRLVLSLREGSRPLLQALSLAGADLATPVTLLSGPEGGLSPAEEEAAIAAGFVPVTLGPRTLRAETAPLAGLTLLTLAVP